MAWIKEQAELHVQNHATPLGHSLTLRRLVECVLREEECREGARAHLVQQYLAQWQDLRYYFSIYAA